MDTVSNSDLASGPNINLPPKKNLCVRFTRQNQLFELVERGKTQNTLTMLENQNSQIAEPCVSFKYNIWTMEYQTRSIFIENTTSQKQA